MSKRIFEILAHILFWVSSSWLLMSGFSIVSIEHLIENGVESRKIQRDSILMVKIAGAISFSFILFYFNVWIIKLGSSPGEFWKTALKSLGLLVSVVLLYQLFTLLNLIPKYPPLPQYLVIGIFVFYYAISFAYALGLSWFRAETERRDLALQKNEAELALLRWQLQPHFLFNSLNNLLAIVNRRQYSNASTAIEKLSMLLRYVIEETNARQVALSREISFVENYIALQLLRFETEEVNLKFSVNGDSTGWLIEPGLFIPFVENAFKFGTEPETKSEININFDLSQPTVLHFSIRNPIIRKGRSEGPGTGIAAVKRRLDLVYKNKYELEISNNKDFSVNLKIQIS